MTRNRRHFSAQGAVAEHLEPRCLLSAAAAPSPPHVAAVLVSGTRWSDSFLRYLSAHGMGDGGYAIPTGPGQTASLPWNDIDQIKIRFDQPVTADQTSLTLRGLNGVSYSVSAFNYDASTTTATWTLSAPIGADALVADLAGTISNTSGQQLDGAWINNVSQFPSGNGTSGTDLVFRLNVLPGDIFQDGKVDIRDLVILERNYGATNAGFRQGDLDHDGQVGFSDLVELARTFNHTTPGGPPLTGIFDTDQDIGSPGLAGAYSFISGVYTVTGGGSGIGGSADHFNFDHTMLSGDGSIVARVNSVTSTDPDAEAGVMIRGDSTAGAAFAALVVSPAGQLTFDWRDAAGDPAEQQVVSGVALPIALRLTRQGNTTSASYSADGATWVQVGQSQTIVLGASALAGLAATATNDSAVSTGTFSGVDVGANPAPGAGILTPTDENFLDDQERRAVQFFYYETNPTTGLVPDRANANGGGSGVSSIAAIGFGLSALCVGVHRGFISYVAAYQRVLATLQFLYNGVPNVHGFFYHFLDPKTGQRAFGSEVSTIDTSLLMSGVLTARQFFAGTPLAAVAGALYDRVDWRFMLRQGGAISMGWNPETGSLPNNWSDFNEGLLVYLLAIGSSTHPVPASAWQAWARRPVVTYRGMTFLQSTTAALFTQQYPQGWFDLRNLRDDHVDYYRNSQLATLAQRQMCIDLSTRFGDYGPTVWGISASDGPKGYTVWGGPPASSNIDGTVVPCAAGGSLEFEPRACLDTLEAQAGYGTIRKYGFVDAFNPLTHWTDSDVLGIDLGMTVLSAENCRDGFVWNTFMRNPQAQAALSAAGLRPLGPTDVLPTNSSIFP